MKPGEHYSIRSGDTLSDISERAYGDSTLWPIIHECNRTVIKDPNLIYPDQVIYIPDIGSLAKKLHKTVKGFFDTMPEASADRFKSDPEDMSSTFKYVDEVLSHIEHECDSKNAISIFSIIYASRRLFPYGMWTTQDGTQILFNREYQPLCGRKDGKRFHLTPDTIVENIDDTKTMYFYHDMSSPSLYLTRHLGYLQLDRDQSDVCRMALIHSMAKLREFMPDRATSSVSRKWSLTEFR